MNANHPIPLIDTNDDPIEAACAAACQAVAPAWPLDRAIAVNPHWSRIGMPVRRVAARMAVLSGMQVFPPNAYLRQAWQEGRIARDDLDHALASHPDARQGLRIADCIEALQESLPPRLPLLIDVLDDGPDRETRLSWRQAITHQVSQTCSAYFDESQADWQPGRSNGLYAFWRETITHDHGIGTLMGLPMLGRALAALPATRQEAEAWVLQRLDLPPSVWADYLEAVLLTVNGWAAYCAYLGWQARLAGTEDPYLRDLLAIRLAWGAILLACKDDALASKAFATLRRAWEQAPAAIAEAEQALLPAEVWQAALEAGYQRELACRLRYPGALDRISGQPEVQAAFCIDVRSEPLRRALEAVRPGVRTIGFAGFFGIPAAYTPLGTNIKRPQLPGLLAPRIAIRDHIAIPGDNRTDDPSLEPALTRDRQDRLAQATQWRSASRWPGASFSFVEAAGLGYLGKLAEWISPRRRRRPRDDLTGLPTRYRPFCRPEIVGLDAAAKADLAAGVLHAMGLERHFAPLVLLVGHGSQSHNNAHAAGLDCGACCGQTGEVNARSLARLLNEPEVRATLVERGIVIPPSTWFVAALHNTTTDEIEGFDLDLMPTLSHALWLELRGALEQAGDQVRRERALALGLDPRADYHALLDRLRRRANDGAQTRPEWGLGGNASFIIAPRARTHGVVLQGRSFLHDYDASQDPDGTLLELLMTAPMLVTHWINWQYHASTSDPRRLGSGNKLLHNVVGGTIGVFEGNGGDLRIGLPRQSLHDGKRWMHEPLRLTVVIDAPRAAIERVLASHAVVRQLVDNGWLHLWRFEGAWLQRYAGGTWNFIEWEAV